MRENIITVWKGGRCARAVWSGLPEAISAVSAAGPGEERRASPTLYELGMEYDDAARLLRERIREIEGQREQERDDGRRLLLDHRLRLLRSMWRDTRALAAHLEHYYERGVSRNANYVIR